MANLEMNKIFAAPLVAGIVFMGAGILSEVLIHPQRLAQSAIRIGDAPAAAAAAPVAAAILPVSALLAAASVDSGRGLAQRNCAACHSFNDGGRAGVGPNLYGIVNRNHGQTAGFSYSAGLRAMADKPWDYESLNTFIAAPARAITGTRMAYAGLANPAQRADLIVYLRSLATTPAPLP